MSSVKMIKNSRNAHKNGLKPYQNTKNQPVKAYNVAILSDNSAEINMYGEVVSSHPVDWWTGEKLPGNFIALDEFLKDIEEIKEKDDITIHIDSEGGDLYAGLAIYNRLKGLKGSVTTINDGMAASAASLIFQAGKTRKMNAGSNLMAHGVSGFLYGYYNVEDLERMINQFEAHNKAILNVYMEKSGMSEKDAKALLDGETWLTGQEAIDMGLADELIEEEKEEEEEFMDKLVSRIRTSFYANPLINSALPTENPQDKADITNQLKQNAGGTEEMDIKTMDELRNAFPQLVAQLETEARNAGITEGTTQERARLQGIEAIEGSIADKTMLNNAKYGENPMNAEGLALEFMKAQSGFGAQVLNNLEADAGTSGATSVDPAPNSGNEPTEEETKNVFSVAIDAFNKMRNGGNK